MKAAEPISNRRGTPGTLLEVQDLTIAFGRAELRSVVSGVSLAAADGECVAIVGESGSGKTVTCFATLGLLRGATVRGKVIWNGSVFDPAVPRSLAPLRGRNIAILPQHFAGAFNPVRTIGAQMIDVIRLHHGGTKPSAIERAAALLAELSVDSPKRRLREYPHQQSGGILQRIALATALSCEPRLLIADEPTSALDVTSQQVLLDQLQQARESRRLTLVLVSHNLSVVARIAQRAYVFAQGKVVEHGNVQQILTSPENQETERLVRAARAFTLP
jgi:ABC-type glutathione transport system ATPase component